MFRDGRPSAGKALGAQHWSPDRRQPREIHKWRFAERLNAWKIPHRRISEAAGFVRIVPPMDRVTGLDVASAVVATDAKDCKGKFASGRTSELVDSDVVFRGFSSCEDSGAARLSQYFIVSRTKGGFCKPTGLEGLRAGIAAARIAAALPLRHSATWLVGSALLAGRRRHHKLYDTFVDRVRLDAIAGHRLDRRPVLPKNSGSFLAIGSLYLNAAGLPSTLVRYLKEEGVSSRFPTDIDWRLFMAHFSIPRACVEPGHLTFESWVFMRRDNGSFTFAQGRVLRQSPTQRPRGHF
jgi:hypothetical protein